MVTIYVGPELTVLVPFAAVCQYHVSPAGALPLLVSVTPGIWHCGELEVGFDGSAGAILTVPFTVTLFTNHDVVAAFILIT